MWALGFGSPKQGWEKAGPRAAPVNRLEEDLLTLKKELRFWHLNGEEMVLKV